MRHNRFPLLLALALAVVAFGTAAVSSHADATRKLIEAMNPWPAPTPARTDHAGV